ncbi:sigma-54-dependent Fis family transcriptional regulator [Aliikangiella marina]|uniref:Sigma-54-dependent Fis family transcriptional regulator n=1 Tax=Aliikangiella marina TaxID=1712262 RepID=A0A545TJJ8_9GAMM|nr:sigma-54 dependent transcriptional regulator [Aliikangiella marina]TQV77400.1 sigma-54-dependent Fis family transcriptional regulator [Aliikangiella marina]
MSKRLLIIDNPDTISQSLVSAMNKEQWQLEVASSFSQAKTLLVNDELDPHVILCAVELVDTRAINDIGALALSTIDCEWLFITEKTEDSIDEILDDLAFERLNRQEESKRFEKSINRAFRSSLTRRRLNAYSQANNKRYSVDAYLGNSKPVKRVKKMITKLKNVPVSAMVIRGETGTGKGLVAKIVHTTGLRKDGPFIELNCAALPKDLLESQLFGHEAGAFTGAQSRQKGLFEQADGGTLFLDEIGDLDIELQAKLLKAIEEQKIRRLGSEKELAVDVQIIAATGVDLEQAVIANEFRDDLYHRLSVFILNLPALRVRKEDLLELVPHFIAEFNTKANKHVENISDDIWEKLLQHEWPGNVRELRNVLERCVLLSSDSLLPVEWLQLSSSLSNSIDSSPAVSAENVLQIPLDGSLSLESIEARVIKTILERTNFNVTEAAKLLGTTRQTLRYRVQKYGLK